MKTKINKKATSIAEAMVIMLVVVSWVTWMYHIFYKSTQLSTSTTNKIKAIQIATQWIEAMTNIRDTNWLLFSSDYNNCWNALNYDSQCIWYDTDNSYQIKNSWSYKIYRNFNNRWYTSSWITADYSDSNYRDFFRVWLNNWIFTQTWTTINLRPVFTREILINYLPNWLETDPKMEITSIVQWSDWSSSVPHKVELKQVLSNWKK